MSKVNAKSCHSIHFLKWYICKSQHLKLKREIFWSLWFHSLTKDIYNKFGRGKQQCFYQLIQSNIFDVTKIKFNKNQYPFRETVDPDPTPDPDRKFQLCFFIFFYQIYNTYSKLWFFVIYELIIHIYKTKKLFLFKSNIIFL